MCQYFYIIFADRQANITFRCHLLQLVGHRTGFFGSLDAYPFFSSSFHIFLFIVYSHFFFCSRFIDLPFKTTFVLMRFLASEHGVVSSLLCQSLTLAGFFLSVSFWKSVLMASFYSLMIVVFLPEPFLPFTWGRFFLGPL